MLPKIESGLVYRDGLFIPKFTVMEHPEFATYNGYVGEHNRQKVASTFLKPTTW